MNKLFEQCYEVFVKELFNEEDFVPKICDFADLFCSHSDNITHNCLACGFAEPTTHIKLFLERTKKYEDVSIEFDFTVYILLLYLMVERIETVFKIISLPEKIKTTHFKVFNQIRKWSNFIKHPKSFILTHHPQYDYVNSGIGDDTSMFSVVIDDNFVTQYYSGLLNPNDLKNTNNQLYKKLRNNDSVLVVYPNIVCLTEKFCKSYLYFIDLIKSNKVYRETLEDDTNLKIYFSEEEDNGSSEESNLSNY